MIKSSNFQPPLASNPANGISDIPLSGQGIEGVTKDELEQLLNKVCSASKNFESLSDQINVMADRVKDTNLRHQLYKLSKALLMSNNGRTRTKDPITKKLDPSYQDIANKINELYLKKVKAVTFNLKEAQVKKKKKTRGNPFRVLMGKVGKLLDHGVEKNDIVRYISKLKYWNKETIERAVDIVRDYNRKLENDKDKNDSDDDKKTAEVLNLDELVEKDREVENDKENLEKTVKQMNETEKEFNKKASVKIAGLNYSAKPDFKKRSTGELIMRACFLMDLQDYSKTTKQGDFKEPADKSGVKQELAAIKTALIDRGFDKEELSMLGLGN